MSATAPNMGLKVWNLLTDPYDHSQLASNWAKVDQHDHSTGKGVQIPTGGISDGAISTAKLGDEQVTGTKLVAAVAESGGINTATRTYRKFVTNEETYSNSTTSYTLVDSGTVYVPVNGRLTIGYLSLHKATTSTASAQLFIDGIEAKVPAAGGAPTVFAVASMEASTFFGPLRTASEALFATKGVTADSTFVTTGMASTSIALVGLTTGTHKVEIKAKAGVAGKIEIKNRFLWLKGEAFA